MTVCVSDDGFTVRPPEITNLITEMKLPHDVGRKHKVSDGAVGSKPMLSSMPNTRHCCT
jgi:hypothetical protein